MTIHTLNPVQNEEELAFAERAAVYLERKGLDKEAVVLCLMTEFELDRDTASALAALAA